MRHETRILNYLKKTRPKGDYKISEIGVEVRCYVLPLKWGIYKCLGRKLSFTHPNLMILISR